MTQDEEEILKATKRILRVAEQSSHSANVPSRTDSSQKIDDRTVSTLLNGKVGSRTAGQVLSKVIFGIGMLFVAVITAQVAANLPDKDGKLMFGGFAFVCLLVGVYNIDLTTRWIRKSNMVSDQSSSE